MRSQEKTRKRLLTDRSHGSGSWDGLEICENGVVMWVGADDGCEFAFPVDLPFIVDKFAQVGRQFDVDRMPSNFQKDPYHVGVVHR